MNWHGNEKIEIRVDDTTWYEVSFFDSKEIEFTVNAVNDVPQLVVPTSQVMQEDSTLFIHGINISDVDSVLINVSFTSDAPSIAVVL